MTTMSSLQSEEKIGLSSSCLDPWCQDGDPSDFDIPGPGFSDVATVAISNSRRITLPPPKRMSDSPSGARTEFQPILDAILVPFPERSHGLFVLSLIEETTGMPNWVEAFHQILPLVQGIAHMSSTRRGDESNAVFPMDAFQTMIELRVSDRQDFRRFVSEQLRAEQSGAVPNVVSSNNFDEVDEVVSDLTDPNEGTTKRGTMVRGMQGTGNLNALVGPHLSMASLAATLPVGSDTSSLPNSIGYHISRESTEPSTQCTDDSSTKSLPRGQQSPGN